MTTALSREEVTQTVRRLAAEQVGVPPETLSLVTHLVNDLNYDSLDAVEFIMHVEEAFEVDVPDERAETVKTVGDAVELLMSLREAPAAGTAGA